MAHEYKETAAATPAFLSMIMSPETQVTIVLGEHCGPDVSPYSSSIGCTISITLHRDSRSPSDTNAGETTGGPI